MKTWRGQHLLGGLFPFLELGRGALGSVHFLVRKEGRKGRVQGKKERRKERRKERKEGTEGTAAVSGERMAI